MWRRACLSTAAPSAAPSLLLPAALRQRRGAGAGTRAAASQPPEWATAVERLPGGVAIFADLPRTCTAKAQAQEVLASVRRRTEACLAQRSRLRRCYVAEVRGGGSGAVPQQVSGAAHAGFEVHEVSQPRYTEGKAAPVHISLAIDLADVGAQAPTHLVVAASGVNRTVVSLAPQLSAMSCPLWVVLSPGTAPSSSLSQAGVGQIAETECYPPFTYT